MVSSLYLYLHGYNFSNTVSPNFLLHKFNLAGYKLPCISDRMNLKTDLSAASVWHLLNNLGTATSSSSDALTCAITGMVKMVTAQVFTTFIIYIYKSETSWLGVFVCVLLGDGGLLPCSGGVFFLVSSRWYFLWGPFRGYISLLASGVVTGREGSLLLW
jgi:hypothetical protein